MLAPCIGPKVGSATAPLETELVGVRDREYQVLFSDNSNLSPSELSSILLSVASSRSRGVSVLYFICLLKFSIVSTISLSIHCILSFVPYVRFYVINK